MAYPVRTLIRPACLNGQYNGKLDPKVLISTPGQAGGQTVRLVEPAARAWRALCAAALAAGHVLKPTSSVDSYRPYGTQELIFRERYTTQYLAGRPYKTWNEQRWYQRPGTAVAAVPGTSNHGWGLAVDTGEERDSDAGTESLDDPTLRWLLANEERFGWSHEVQSEPWHLRYFAGDDVPAAVLAYEAQPDEGDDDMPNLLIKGDTTTEWWFTDGMTKRYCGTVEEAGQHAYAGLVRWNDGGPFVVPQSMVDALPRCDVAGLGGVTVKQVQEIVHAVISNTKLTVT